MSQGDDSENNTELLPRIGSLPRFSTFMSGIPSPFARCVSVRDVSGSSLPANGANARTNLFGNIHGKACDDALKAGGAATLENIKVAAVEDDERFRQALCLQLS